MRKYTVVVYGEQVERNWGVWRKRKVPMLSLDVEAADVYCAVEFAAEKVQEDPKESHEQT